MNAMSHLPGQRGHIWLVANNEHAFLKAEKEYTAKGAVVQSVYRGDLPNIHFRLEMDKNRAKDILGYEPGLYDWVDTGEDDPALQRYIESFNMLKPSMQAVSEQVHQWVCKLVADPYLVHFQTYPAGDEEFQLNADWEIRGQDESIVGISIRLVDPACHEEDPPAPGHYGIFTEIIGYGGRVLGNYAPYNYTNDLYTDDFQELKRRVIDVPIYEMAKIVVDHFETSAQQNTNKAATSRP